MGVFALRLSSVTPVGVISMLYIQSRLSTLTLTLLPSCTPRQTIWPQGHTRVQGSHGNQNGRRLPSVVGTFAHEVQCVQNIVFKIWRGI